MSPDERARRRLDPPSGTSTASASGSGSQRAALAVAAFTPRHPGDTGASPDSPLSAAAAGLPRGDTARYQLEGVHARGGLGRVVKAHDQQLHRTVAIKELLKRSPSAEARFVREALITARLQHPGVVPVHEAGRWPSGDPYYSMKLVSGRTLKELSASRRSLDERVALVPHVLAVAEAIAYAHSQKVIHRDIKPANVIVGDFGETVVVDWGLAKDLSGVLPEDDVTSESQRPVIAAAGSDSTAVGKVMGTPSYMSPEQARGQELDERADVYSLGALLYEVLSGDAPFTGSTADEILQRALEASPAPIDTVQPAAPPDLVAIVTKAMARFPEDRYPTAVELAEDIRRFQTGQLVTARHYSTRTLVRRWIARHRAVVGVAAAAAAALALTGAYAVHRVVDQRNVARAERATAQRAQSAAEDRSHELAFQQAQSSLARDPTATLGWLKTYPATGRHADALPALLDEATALGVARHVLRHPSWAMGIDYVADTFAVSTDMDGGIYRWDLTTGQGWEIARHQDGAWLTQLSPDRRTLAVGGKGGLIGLYPTSGTGVSRVLEGHRDMVDALQFSRDGSRLMSWGKDLGVRVWDVASGTPLLVVGDDKVASGSITPDGDAVIVSYVAGDVVRVEIDGRLQGGERRRLGHYDSPILRTAIAPAGDRMLAHALDGTVRMIDLGTGQARVFGNQDAKLGWAGFSPSGARAATGGVDGTIRLYDAASAKGNEITLRGHEDSIYHFEFSPDESVLASASDDGTARVWDLTTREVRVLRGHEDDVYRIAFRSDGRELATSSLDGTVRVWPLDFADGRVFEPAPGESYGLRFTGDGQQLFTFGKGKLFTWDVATGVRNVRATLSGKMLEQAKKGKIMDPAIDADGDLVATADADGLVHVWSVKSGQHHVLAGHREKLSAFTLSSDGTTMVTADRGGTVLVWDLRGAADGTAPRSRVLWSDRVVRAASLSRDGSQLATGDEGRLELFDVATGASIRSADLAAAGAGGHRPMYLVYSPDGRHIVAPMMAGDSLLWNLETGAVRRIPHHGYHIVWMTFSPDSRSLAVSLSDRTVRVWDLAKWTTVTLDGHRDLVMRVAFHPDGKVLATGSYDKTVRLWDAATGQALRVLRGHNTSVDAVAFAPDGRQLASAGRDGTLRIWDLDALPPNHPQAVQSRLAAATTAIIDGGRATTPTGLRAATADRRPAAR
jgi:WD40 repeat protein/tRNA A-37 threonylcarbamoyl transferase component Bud32